MQQVLATVPGPHRFLVSQFTACTLVEGLLPLLREDDSGPGNDFAKVGLWAWVEGMWTEQTQPMALP